MGEGSLILPHADRDFTNNPLVHNLGSSAPKKSRHHNDGACVEGKHSWAPSVEQQGQESGNA